MTEPLISPIRPDQISSAARAMANAFANAPRYTFLLPDDAQRRAKLPWVWGTAIRTCVYSGGVVDVAHDGYGSDVLGVAIWNPPHQRRHGVLTLLRSGLWAAPIRLGIPGLAASARSGPRARRDQAALPILVPEWNWSRSFKSTQWSGKRSHQPHAGAG